MQQTFYVNVLFGAHKARILDELLKVVSTTMADKTALRLQIHPFRQSPIMSTNRTLVKEHLYVMEEIKASSMQKNKPFQNVIFVNYNTDELEPALKYNRIQYYLCDFLNEENIELLTLVSPIFINFLRKSGQDDRPSTINSYFLNYSLLTFYDTDADKRIGKTTTLDVGEETEDDLTFLLQTKLYNTHITDDDDTTNLGKGVILPYHPFRNSFFTAVQNTKDNLNAIFMSQQKHLLFYPFGQEEWLRILETIMYEHIFLNYLISDRLYAGEKIAVRKEIYRNSASANYRHFHRLLKKYTTPVLNEVVFEYDQVFAVRTDSGDWYRPETRIHHTNLTTDMLCLTTANGVFV